MRHEHKPPIEGGPNPCPHCPPIPTQAQMDKMICVGFGEATLCRDGEVVIDASEAFSTAKGWDEIPTFATAERIAATDPGHDWTIRLHGPLHGETYQRQGEGVWILVERNKGFA